MNNRASPHLNLWKRLAIDKKRLRLALQTVKQAQIYLKTVERQLAETQKAVIKIYGVEFTTGLKKIKKARANKNKG